KWSGGFAVKLLRSKEEKEAANKARGEFEQFLVLLKKKSPLQVRSAVADMKGTSGLGPAALSGRERERLGGQALRAYADRVLADDVLSDAEEQAFLGVCDAVGLDDQAWTTKYRDIMFRLVIAKVND